MAGTKLVSAVVVVFGFIALTSAQPGGIGKRTFAVSNPDVPGRFVQQHLGGVAQGPEPTVRHTACAWYNKFVIAEDSLMFNIQTHFVNATARP